MLAFNNHHIAQVLGIICIVVFFVYVVFAYFYLSEDQKLKKILTDYQSLELPALKTTTKEDCLNKYSSYYLSDFYVASSAMSFLIGNQKYDYVSQEMIKNALIMGARYIELEVLNESVGYQSHPIVTTGYQQGQWQTSLNYIDFEDTCRVISEFAFSREIKTHQWPLFIYLKLKVSDNPRTINQIRIILNKIFPSVEDDPRAVGNRFPAQMNPAETRICSLFNQVVIWSDPVDAENWDKSDKKIYQDYYKVVNEKSPIRLHHVELDTYTNPKTKTKTKVPKTPEDHRAESDALTEHNRRNLSIVYPSTDEDSQSFNYLPQEGWSYGCQFVALNYQIGDQFRNDYFEKFKEDSLVLKPNGLRVVQTEKEQKSIDSLVPDQAENRDQIRRQLPFLLKDQPFYLRPFEDPTKVLSHYRTYLEVLEKPDDQIDLDDTFLIKESLSKKPDHVSIVSTKKPFMYLILADNTFVMSDWRIAKNTEDKDNFIRTSSFTPMTGFNQSRSSGNDAQTDNNISNDILSFYVGGQKKNILTYHAPSQETLVQKDDPQDYGLANQSSFSLVKLPVKRMYNIRRSNGAYVKVNHNLAQALNNTLNDKGIFEFVSEADTGLKIPKDTKYDYIHIKTSQGTYWTIKDETRLRTNANKPGKYTRFYLEKHGSIYKIFYGGDRRSLPILVQSDGILKLAQRNEKNKPSAFFILGQSYKKKEEKN